MMFKESKFNENLPWRLAENAKNIQKNSRHFETGVVNNPYIYIRWSVFVPSKFIHSKWHDNRSRHYTETAVEKPQKNRHFETGE